MSSTSLPRSSKHSRFISAGIQTRESFGQPRPLGFELRATLGVCASSQERQVTSGGETKEIQRTEKDKVQQLASRVRMQERQLAQRKPHALRRFASAGLRLLLDGGGSIAVVDEVCRRGGTRSCGRSRTGREGRRSVRIVCSFGPLSVCFFVVVEAHKLQEGSSRSRPSRRTSHHDASPPKRTRSRWRRAGG